MKMLEAWDKVRVKYQSERKSSGDAGQAPHIQSGISHQNSLLGKRKDPDQAMVANELEAIGEFSLTQISKHNTAEHATSSQTEQNQPEVEQVCDQSQAKYLNDQVPELVLREMEKICQSVISVDSDEERPFFKNPMRKLVHNYSAHDQNYSGQHCVDYEAQFSSKPNLRQIAGTMKPPSKILNHINHSASKCDYHLSIQKDDISSDDEATSPPPSILKTEFDKSSHEPARTLGHRKKESGEAYTGRPRLFQHQRLPVTFLNMVESESVDRNPQSPSLSKIESEKTEEADQYGRKSPGPETEPKEEHSASKFDDQAGQRLSILKVTPDLAEICEQVTQADQTYVFSSKDVFKNWKIRAENTHSIVTKFLSNRRPDPRPMVESVLASNFWRIFEKLAASTGNLYGFSVEFKRPVEPVLIPVSEYVGLDGRSERRDRIRCGTYMAGKAVDLITSLIEKTDSSCLVTLNSSGQNEHFHMIILTAAGLSVDEGLKLRSVIKSLSDFQDSIIFPISRICDLWDPLVTSEEEALIDFGTKNLKKPQKQDWSIQSALKAILSMVHRKEVKHTCHKCVTSQSTADEFEHFSEVLFSPNYVRDFGCTRWQTEKNFLSELSHIQSLPGYFKRKVMACLASRYNQAKCLMKLNEEEAPEKLWLLSKAIIKELLLNPRLQPLMERLGFFFHTSYCIGEDMLANHCKYLILSGASDVGKSTLVEMLQTALYLPTDKHDFDGLKLCRVPSATYCEVISYPEVFNSKPTKRRTKKVSAYRQKTILSYSPLLLYGQMEGMIKLMFKSSQNRLKTRFNILSGTNGPIGLPDYDHYQLLEDHDKQDFEDFTEQATKRYIFCELDTSWKTCWQEYFEWDPNFYKGISKLFYYILVDLSQDDGNLLQKMGVLDALPSITTPKILPRNIPEHGLLNTNVRIQEVVRSLALLWLIQLSIGASPSS